MSEQFDLDFSDLVLVELPVKSPAGEELTLREPSGAAATRWYNAQAQSVKFGADGKPMSLGDVASLEPLLVHLCLFDKNGKNVPEKTIGSWPSRVQKSLFDKAQEIGNLKKDVKLSELVNEIFKREDCEFSIVEIRQYLAALVKEDRKKYLPVQLLFSPTDEELSKNSQTNTTDGLD